MKWIEVSISTTNEGIEPICGMLMECGITGTQIEDIKDMKNFLLNNKEQWDYIDESLLNCEDDNAIVKFYVSNDPSGKEIVDGVKQNLLQLASLREAYNLGKLELTLENVDDESWLNEWKKYYKPFEIGKNIVVKPVWEEYENNNKLVFNINPGHVFGTGLHQTTKLCVTSIEKYLQEGQGVLDLGCGSGILSIISLLLGAKTAYAVDIDNNAINIAYENASLNGIYKDRYKVVAGNVITNEEIRNEIYSFDNDIVVANIVADVIISLLSFVHKCISKDGVFICSGIISERVDEVKESLIRNEFEILEVLELEGWYCVVSKKKYA